MQLIQFLQISVKRAIQDKQGQDLIEYALMGGFVAVAAGIGVPGVANSIGTICSSVVSVLSAATLQPGQGVL